MTFNYDCNVFLFHGATIDRAAQKVVPTSLEPLHLYQSYYSSMAAHPGEERMYNWIPWEYYWQLIANDVSMAVTDYCQLLGNKLSEKRRRPLQLFPTKDPLEFVGMDILGPLSNSPSGNQFLLAVMDHYIMLTRTVLTSQKTASPFASFLLNHREISYGIPTHLITDIGTQFIRKCFESISGILGTKQLSARVYHP